MEATVEVARAQVIADRLDFPYPTSPSPEQELLQADIRSLQRRTGKNLTGRSAMDRVEVLELLANAANSGVFGKHLKEGRQIYENAEKAYGASLQASNRITYLKGVLVAIAVGMVLAALAYVANRFATPHEQRPIEPLNLVLLVPLVAAAGSIASLLTRLASIDLRQESDPFFVALSGFTKPFVAAIVASAVAIMIDAQIIDLRVGPSEDKLQLILVASFLCGFTERFGIDVISSVPFGKGSPEQKE